LFSPPCWAGCCLLVVASSSFVYVAVADLIPQLQHRLPLRDTAEQLVWLGGGLAIVLIATSSMHH
jgi:zinc and cadmium transporter